MRLEQIKKVLKEKGNQKVKESFKKYIPSARKIYGVKTPILNSIVKEIENPSFELVEELWREESLEERLLAAKILGRVAGGDREGAIEFIEKFSRDISNWAVCDTLATQGIGKIAKNRPEEVFKISQKYISSKSLWQRRLALVLLIEINRAGFSKNRIRRLIVGAEEDEEPYVRKALNWLKRELKKY